MTLRTGLSRTFFSFWLALALAALATLCQDSPRPGTLARKSDPRELTHTNLSKSHESDSLLVRAGHYVRGVRADQIARRLLKQSFNDEPWNCSVFSFYSESEDAFLYSFSHTGACFAPPILIKVAGDGLSSRISYDDWYSEESRSTRSALRTRRYGLAVEALLDPGARGSSREIVDLSFVRFRTLAKSKLQAVLSKAKPRTPRSSAK